MFRPWRWKLFALIFAAFFQDNKNKHLTEFTCSKIKISIAEKGRAHQMDGEL